MKKALIIAFLIGIFSANAFSQTMPNYPFGVGAYVAASGGVNAADVPQGIKNGFMISPMPNIGAQAYIPLSETAKSGLLAEISYSTYAFELKFSGNEDVAWDNSFNYLTFAPYFHISGFVVGVNFGLPMGGESVEQDIDASDLAALVEFKLGGVIPLMENPNGRLNLMLRAGYALTGLYAEDITSQADSYNPHPASIELGLSYIFNISKD